MLKKSKQSHTNQKLKKALKLLPIFSFFLASFLFVFAFPAPSPADSGTPSMSMSSSGHGLHSDNYKVDSHFTPLAGLLSAACCAVLFVFFSNNFVSSHIFPKTFPASTGIRAPPFQS